MKDTLCAFRGMHGVCNLPESSTVHRDKPNRKRESEMGHAFVPSSGTVATLVERLRSPKGDRGDMLEAADKLERLTWLVNGWPGQHGDRIREILNDK